MVPKFSVAPVPYSASAGTGAKFHIGTVALQCTAFFGTLVPQVVHTPTLQMFEFEQSIKLA